MPLASLPPRQSRRLAVGLLLGAIVAIVAVVAIPLWLLHRHYDVALAENADKLERYRRLAGTRPQVAKQLEAMRAKDTPRFFLRSGAASLSAAQAQEVLRALIEQQGGRLVTMGAPVSKEEGRYRLVTVNVQLIANVFALRKIFNALETATPYLFIDNLTVRTQVAPGHRLVAGQEPEMFVNFDVSGYSQTGS
jgi:general secretion pathway protein M